MATTKSPQQSIEELRERYESLNQKRIVFQTRRDSAQEQLNELKASALEQYGTDDVDQLQKKLEQLKSENEVQRKKYQVSLEEIETQLDSIQEKFNATSESGSA